MQVISAQHAISLYPFATFSQRRSLVLKTKGNDQTTAIQKYKDRGWTICKQADVLLEAANTSRWTDFRGCLRRVGDRLCWNIPLPDVRTPPDYIPLASDPVHGNSWGLRHYNSTESKIAMETLLDFETESRFQFQYVIARPYWEKAQFLVEAILELGEDRFVCLRRASVLI